VIKQVLYLIRKFGLFNLARTKRRHDRSLPVIRGYVTCCAFWALLNEGFLDAVREKGSVSLNEYSGRRGLDYHVLKSVCEYLDVVRIVRLDGDICFLEPLGRTFMQEPRGTFDLLFGYESVFHNLGGLLDGSRKHGEDVFRRGDFIAKGSGELGVQLPFPMMIELAREFRVRKVLDLGCGDLEFLFALCSKMPQTRCWAIDNSEEAVRYASDRLTKSPFASRVKIARLDMFDIEKVREFAGDVDGITAVDVFHEYLSDGTEKVERFLSRMKEAFEGSRFIIGEFCKQPHERLRKNPTGFLEHDLFHNLTGQTIVRADEWMHLFKKAGLKILEKRVFDIVGHGYFVLE